MAVRRKRETKTERLERREREREMELDRREKALREKAQRVEQKRRALQAEKAAYQRAGVYRIETCECCGKVWVRSLLGSVGSAEA